MKSRPKYGFSQYSNSALADKAKRIYDLINGSPIFNAPPVTYAQLLIFINAFKDAIVGAMSGDELKRNLRQECRENLTQALTLIAGYIMSITTEAEVIITTGYDAVVPSGPIGVPEIPQQVEGKSAGTQAIHIDWKPSRGAKNYVVSVTDAADPSSTSAVWTIKGYPTASKLMITEGLNNLTYYWVAVCANGAEGMSDACAPVRVLSI